MPLKMINQAAPIVRMLAVMLFGAFALGVVYTVMTSDIEGLQEAQSAEKLVTSELSKTVNLIKTEQAVIKAKMELEQERDKDFRRSTSKTLDRILKKLDK